MFIDASALCAILLDEPEAGEFSARIAAADVRLTSAVAIYETVRALAREGDDSIPAARNLIDRFLAKSAITLVEIGRLEREVALDALDRFGKGRHSAKLNMGDCFAYACAKAQRVPLLCKGDDFPQTDIELA